MGDFSAGALGFVAAWVDALGFATAWRIPSHFAAFALETATAWRIPSQPPTPRAIPSQVRQKRPRRTRTYF